MSRAFCLWIGVLGLFALVARGAGRIELAWPTPNTAYIEGKSIDAFVQPTVSGEVTSGLFGCVRSGGGQFHEGLDIKPVSRDRRGEATDEIYATMAGVVRHISANSGNSSYGRYIVIEHPDLEPAVYSLYAHLSSIKAGLKIGDTVTRGQVIAIMGRSAGGYTIPKDRAHLHYEIGLMATRNFQSWYQWKKFGSPNEHNLYNGMNLIGVDALDFFNRFRARKVNNFAEYFAGLPAVARVRVATTRIPDFVQRYPALLTAPIPMAGVAGWELKINEVGLPFSWTPLDAIAMAGYKTDEVRLFEVDADALQRFRCKSVAVLRRGSYQPGRDLDTVLQLVFGFR